MPPQNDSFPQPILFEQSRLGGYIDIETADLPHTNTEGKPVIELTPEQRYLFDTQGWLLIPAVLSAGEVDEMRAFCYRLHRDPESLPEPQRTPIAGPLEHGSPTPTCSPPCPPNAAPSSDPSTSRTIWSTRGENLSILPDF